MSILNQISVVVEIGINHGGSLTIAKDMVRTAVECGAMFIKHQTHIPDEEMADAAKDIVPENAEESIYDLITRCTLSEETEKELQLYTESLGATFFSTPFCKAAVDRLERFNVPLYKLASGASEELTDYVASRGKPVILSTGMENISEVSKKVTILEDYGIPYAVLHTTSLYPTPFEKARLGAIQELKTLFPDAIIGYSDHSTSNHACFGAVALGADIIERHLAHPGVNGPDWYASMRTPQDLVDLIAGVVANKQARGGDKEPALEEAGTRKFAFYSLVAARDIQEGEALTRDNLTQKRPGVGLSWASVSGKVAGRKLTQGDLLDATDVL